jgi:N-acetylglucosaminyldiphosphoundecaprenol N-acetyl-beta-D-mannosaminyltransferase
LKPICVFPALDPLGELSFCRSSFRTRHTWVKSLNFQPSGQGHREFITGAEHLDDLSRGVYGVLGIPVDAADLSAVVQRIGAAMRQDQPFLISTPNLNFLVTSQSDSEFRESLLQSDLCPVDGVPIVWISRLLGIPLQMRVAGSDIFDRLKLEQPSSVEVFLFGGPEGVAETCSAVLNSQSSGVVCVGTLYPGFGSVEHMSTEAIIDAINASDARFLVASLGAQKGQSWLLKNHHRLRIPVRSHLGAAINFQAGLLKRAPLFVRRFGFEWLWRIKEEPYLWRRYLQDGAILLKLMMTSVFPLALGAVWRGLFAEDDLDLSISFEEGQFNTVVLAGYALEHHVTKAIAAFREAIDNGNLLTVDVSRLRSIDPRFFGLLLMARKQMVARGGRLQIIGASARIRRAFRLNRFDFLLNSSSTIEKQHSLAAQEHSLAAREMAFAHPEAAIEVSSASGKP